MAQELLFAKTVLAWLPATLHPKKYCNAPSRVLTISSAVPAI
jgi:hypothetical protein